MKPLDSDLFHFEYLISLLGRKTSDIKVKQLLNFISDELSSEFSIVEPQKEDIINENDNWKCYECSKMGLIIEIVNETIASLSFLSGLPTFKFNQEISPCYPYSLLDGLCINSSRIEIKNKFGTPANHSEFMDQFQIDDKITMGVLYNKPDGKASVISYGLSSIFSDPDKSPNRFSLIFWSLS